jgi:hypothetical protein
VHPALAADRTVREVDACEPMHEDDDRFRRGVVGWGLPQQGPAPRQRPATHAIGEETEVANAHEAARHHVQEKASQEFVSVERHHLHAVVVRVVLPTELDAAVTVIDQPIIRERATRWVYRPR